MAHLEGLVETGKGATEALNNALFTVTQLADLVGMLNGQILASCRYVSSNPGNSSAATVRVQFLTEARKDAMDAMNNALLATSRIADLVGSLNRQIITTRCIYQVATVVGNQTMHSSTISEAASNNAAVAFLESEGQTDDVAVTSACGDKPPGEHDTLAANESSATMSQRDVTVEVKEEPVDDEEQRNSPTLPSPKKLMESNNATSSTRQTQMCEKFIRLLRDQPTVELMVLQGLDDLARTQKVKKRSGRKRKNADTIPDNETYEQMIEKRRELAKKYYAERRDRIMLRERLGNQRSLRQRRLCTAKVTSYSEMTKKQEVQVKKEVYI